MADTSVDKVDKGSTEAYEMRSSSRESKEPNQAVRPAGWKYRDFKLGSITIPYYASPQAQLLLVSLVCFLCPGRCRSTQSYLKHDPQLTWDLIGMFNAVNGLGGGGQVDPEASNASNTALYATFAVVGFFAGTVANKLGIRYSLAFGGCGYSLYVASYLSYNITQNFGFVVFAGFFLGCCAGIFWSAQGAIMMSYPPEGSKGRYIAVFWVIFNLGGVIGSLVSYPLIAPFL